MTLFNQTLYHGNVRIELSYFTPEEGVCECHAMLHIAEPEIRFEEQLAAIRRACDFLASARGRGLRPVIKRYLLSDAANQAAQVAGAAKDDAPCAVSIVQQPPLDGSKIALWVYLQSEMEPVRYGNGVTAEHNGYRHIWTAGQCAPEGGSYSQTQTLLDHYADDLEGFGCRLETDCVRTWFFVQNVDVNYGGVVESRKAFFERHGLTPQTRYITSTGIEGRHADPRVSVLFDAYAVKGLQRDQQQILHAPTHLNPTYEYGVTFERGVRVAYGDRSHIFIAGTASIDNKGEIVHPGDIAGQTGRMLENIEVLLAEAGAGMDDVVMMTVYLRDTADYAYVRSEFDRRFGHVPRAITLAPVCRPGWLIETECIALRRERNPQFAPL